MKPPVFPKDDSVHDSTIEWWYFNGQLEDAKKRKYAFMNCLFRVNVKKINLPFVGKVPFKNLYFSHSLVSDLKNNKFYPRIDYVTLASKDSFSKPLFSVNYTSPLIVNGYVNSVMESRKESEYYTKTEDMELTMKSVKKPLLLNGKGYIDIGAKSTYYYSLPNLQTEGTIRIKDKTIKVKGKSWMDHQWADIKYPDNTHDKWTWFSIQLDNNVDIICFEYELNDGKEYFVSVSYPDNKQEHTKDVKLTPINEPWESSSTGKKYQLSWKIEIPSKNITLKVKPLIKHQEMIFGNIKYWEGPLKVEGTMNGKPVKGQGFLELVGRPFQFGNIRFLVKSSLGIVQSLYQQSRVALLDPLIRKFLLSKE